MTVYLVADGETFPSLGMVGVVISHTQGTSGQSGQSGRDRDGLNTEFKHGEVEYIRRPGTGRWSPSSAVSAKFEG